MIDLHLYGKLRRFAPDSDTRSKSVLRIGHESGDTVRSIVARLGIPLEELGSNLFVNGRYAMLGTPIADGDRVGLFPDDMQLLYKWYFAPSSGSAAPNLRVDDSAPGLGKSGSGSEAEA
jgi:molybdopterin converting factor small subunit